MDRNECVSPSALRDCCTAVAFGRNSSLPPRNNAELFPSLIGTSANGAFGLPRR